MFDVTKPTPFGLERRKWPYLAVTLLLLLAVLHWVDVASVRFAQTWPETVRAIFGVITMLGLSDYVLLPSLALIIISAPLALLGRKYTPRLALWQMTGVYAFVFVAVGLPGLAANLVKRLIGRARPEMLESWGALGFNSVFNDHTFQSFPSGHTTTAFATAMVIGFFSPRWLAPALAVAVLVGISRVAIGAHYPTDVLGGTVFGIVGAYAVRNAFSHRRWVFEQSPGGSIVPRRLSAVRRLLRRPQGAAR